MHGSIYYFGRCMVLYIVFVLSFQNKKITQKYSTLHLSRDKLKVQSFKLGVNQVLSGTIPESHKQTFSHHALLANKTLASASLEIKRTKRKERCFQIQSIAICIHILLSCKKMLNHFWIQDKSYIVLLSTMEYASNLGSPVGFQIKNLD